MRLTTTRGYQLSDVASALQKCIRRGDARLAGYFAVEMFESNYGAYAWRRLLTISAEDCSGIVTTEIMVLFDAFNIIRKAQPHKGRVLLAKATILLCLAPKSRDADHLTNLVYDPAAVADDVIERELTEARATVAPIPDFAFDVHTGKGKQRGKTKRDFMLAEHEALVPRAPGLFDDDLERLRRGELILKPKGGL